MLSGDSDTLSTDTVFCIQLSSTVNVHSIIDMTLNSPTISGISFVGGAFLMHSDPVVSAGGLSKEVLSRADLRSASDRFVDVARVAGLGNLELGVWLLAEDVQ